MTEGFVAYIVDTETTGLSIKCDIIELSMCRLSFENDKPKVEQKTWFLRALNKEAIEDKALLVNHFKKEDILGLTTEGAEKHKLPSVVITDIENWICDDNVSAIDRIFCGQNVLFDLDRMRELWKRNGREKDEDFPFAVERNNRIIDTKQIIAFFDLATGKRRQNFSLGALLKSCGIKKNKEQKMHSAEVDTDLTTKLLIKLLLITRDIIKEKFNNCYGDEKENIE